MRHQLAPRFRGSVARILSSAAMVDRYMIELQQATSAPHGEALRVNLRRQRENVRMVQRGRKKWSDSRMQAKKNLILK